MTTLEQCFDFKTSNMNHRIYMLRVLSGFRSVMIISMLICI